VKLDPFYLIVDSSKWIERLVPLGVKLVQLRVKDRPQGSLRAEIRRSKAICAAADCQLVVNDHWRLAIDEGCDFIHLGQEDLADADLGAIQRAGLKLGLSTHDELERATAVAADPDYVALGPIWATRLKQMKWAPQGIERLRDWRLLVGGLPLVAIGGITAERAPMVLKGGADCAAVVTDIASNSDPEAQTLRWIAATQPWRTPSPQDWRCALR
jgi:thiamine-phosphate pyrophosphorylase